MSGGGGGSPVDKTTRILRKIENRIDTMEDAMAMIAKLEEQGSRMSASQCVEPKNLCVEEGRAEVFCCAVEKIARLEAALQKCKEQRDQVHLQFWDDVCPEWVFEQDNAELDAILKPEQDR